LFEGYPVYMHYSQVLKAWIVSDRLQPSHNPRKLGIHLVALLSRQDQGPAVANWVQFHSYYFHGPSLNTSEIRHRQKLTPEPGLTADCLTPTRLSSSTKTHPSTPPSIPTSSALLVSSTASQANGGQLTLRNDWDTSERQQAIPNLSFADVGIVQHARSGLTEVRLVVQILTNERMMLARDSWRIRMTQALAEAVGIEAKRISSMQKSATTIIFRFKLQSAKIAKSIASIIRSASFAELFESKMKASGLPCNFLKDGATGQVALVTTGRNIISAMDKLVRGGEQFQKQLQKTSQQTSWQPGKALGKWRHNVNQPSVKAKTIIEALIAVAIAICLIGIINMRNSQNHSKEQNIEPAEYAVERPSVQSCYQNTSEIGAPKGTPLFEHSFDGCEDSDSVYASAFF